MGYVQRLFLRLIYYKGKRMEERYHFKVFLNNLGRNLWELQIGDRDGRKWLKALAILKGISWLNICGLIQGEVKNNFEASAPRIEGLTTT
jgi:hypothetical protein